MKRRISFLYALIPILYISVIGLLLYMQFAVTRPISEKVGSLELTGTLRPRTPWSDAVIEDLRVTYHGMVFAFTREEPFVLRAAQGPQKKLSVLSYDLHPRGIKLFLERGVEVGFEMNGSFGGQVSLTLVMQEEESCLIPFDVGDARVERAESVPLVIIRNAAGEFEMALPPGVRVDTEAGYLSVLRSAQSQAITISAAEEGKPDNLYLRWFDRSGALRDIGDFEREVRAYLDKAYSGWTSGRYVKGRGLWQVKGAEPQFSESIGRVMIGEALKRGDYRRVSAFFVAARNMKKAYDPDFAVAGYLTSPYVGGLEKHRPAHLAENARQANAVRDMIRRRDPAVFQVENLLALLLNANMFAQIDELVSGIVVNLDTSDQDPEIWLGMLATYLEVLGRYPEGEIYFSHFPDIVETGILPRIRLLNGQLLMGGLTSDVCDIRWSLQFGRLLRQLGKIQASEALARLGRSLILSAISYSDELGFLPPEVSCAPGPAGDFSGGAYIAPEDIYGLVSDWPFLPSQTPLYPHFEPGTWVWSAAELEEVAVDRETHRFVVSFPRGESHYLFIQGLDAFQSLELKGVRWAAAKDYYRYHSGWNYDKASRTLYVKLRQDKDLEEIVLRY